MAPPHQPPEHAANSAANCATGRASLRREKIAARAALTPAEHARLNRLVEGHLASELAPHCPGVLAFCWPIRNEFDARPLAASLLAAGWRAAMPTVVERNAPMVFRPWTPEGAMTQDPYGIPVPDSTAIAPPPDVVLLPLVAFDGQGFRLGYGGGYFDRTLAALVPRPLTLGVGFELARVADIHPEAHDIPLDRIVTEAGVLRFD